MNRTEWFILLWVLAGVIYGVYAAVFLPREMAVSVTVTRLCKEYPILAAGLGLLIGHWLWGSDP